jgi:hypothetical protein
VGSRGWDRRRATPPDLGFQVFDSPDALDPYTLVLRLRDEETVVTVHTRKAVRLEMAVTRGGAPAAGWNLWGILRGISCGTIVGIRATTGEDGWIREDFFDAESLSEVWFEAPDGKRLWTADPLDLIANQPVLVELPAGE